MSTRTPRDLTQGPIGRNLLLFSLPILGGNIAQSLNGSVNAVWIGRHLGEDALTAAANANNIMFFLLGSMFGLGMAASILIAQAMGARDTAQSITSWLARCVVKPSKPSAIIEQDGQPAA